MATTALGTVLHDLRRTFLRRDEAGLTDSELLECFIARRDEAAFEALLRRHGPMVLGVCRRVLRNEDDAEDAFQATFLVLVRKAASIRPRGMVGNWLYGVAHSTSLKARAMSTKRLAKEREAAARPKPEAAETSRQLHALLDQELRALPDNYRAAIVLCDLEGKSIKESAGQLGCPPGTVASRLARGRCMLARRLARQGLALSGGVIATVLSHNVASASVPLPLVTSTVKAASLFAAGQAASGVACAKVAALTEGVLKAMLLTKLKIATTLFLAVAVIASLGVVTQAQDGRQRDAKRLAQLRDGQAKDAKSDPAPKPAPPADDPDAKWPTDPPRILELQPYLFNPRPGNDTYTVGSVWKELKLSEKQIEELGNVYLELHKLHEGKSDPDRGREWTKGMHDKLPQMLKPEQIKRFKQINLQMLGGPLGGTHPGVGAFSYPEIQRELKFNDKQEERIKAINEKARKEYESEQKKVFDAGGAWTGELHFEHSSRIHKAALEEALPVLTEEQKKAWKKMTGEPFEYERGWYKLENGEYKKVDAANGE